MDIHQTSSAVSPSSRTRLVVASQALEIQHLQSVIGGKDKELHEVTSTVLGDKAALERQLAANVCVCHRHTLTPQFRV